MSIKEKLPIDFGIMCFSIQDSAEVGKFFDTYYPRTHCMSWNNTAKSIYGIKDGRIDCWSAGTYEDVPLFTIGQIRDFIRECSKSEPVIINEYPIY